MTTQKDIDKYFSLNYKKVKELATVYVRRNNRYDLEPEAMISEAYLYLIERQEQMNPEDIEPFCLKFIQNETRWTMGKVSKLEGIKDKPILQETIDDRTTMNDVKEKELKLQSIESVYEGSTDKIKTIVHNVFFHKGKTTSRTMAKHFGIGSNAAFILIRNLKTDIHEKHKKILLAQT